MSDRFALDEAVQEEREAERKMNDELTNAIDSANTWLACRAIGNDDKHKRADAIVSSLIRAVELLAGQRGPQPVSTAYTFDGDLVERLARTVEIAEHANGRMDLVGVVRVILAELAKTPCELLTVDELKTATDGGGYVAAHALVCRGLAPVLAAKSARIAEVEARLIECQRLLITRVEAARLDAANAHIAELEKQLVARATHAAEALRNVRGLVESAERERIRRGNALDVIDAEIAKLGEGKFPDGN